MIRLRYPAQCTRCEQPLVPGVDAHWNPSTRCVTCDLCAGSGDPFSFAESIDHGSPGANLERLTENGGSTARSRAFDKGAHGERHVGAVLENIPQSRVLHSRRLGRGDIDHIVIAPSGVWVVDAKNYQGAVTVPFLGKLEQLRVGGRRIDRQLASLRHQREAVKAQLAEGARVCGALCFIETQWPLTRQLFMDGALVVAPPKRLARHITNQRPHLPTLTERLEVAERLSEAFPAVT